MKYKGNAYADAPPAPASGGYPVVIFSHGFAGYPEQSLDITTHLASWGFVVAAPDHVERSLDGILGTAAKGVPKMTDVAVLQATLDLVVTDSKAAGLLHGVANANEVVTAGHSAGAGAAYSFAWADPRVKAWISYSVGFGGRGGPAPSAPTKPGMVMLGSDGCTKDHPPVEKAFPAIDQLTVAFFRSALHIDSAPVGLDTQAVANLGASVTVTKG